MQVFEGRGPLPPGARGASVALGAFDGLHLGHVAVINAARAARPEAPLAVAAFEPPPKCFFQPNAPAFRLNTPRLRRERAADLGVALLIELPFDAALASMSAQAFAHEVIGQGLAPAHLTVGHDFRFGADRVGDADLLEAAGRAAGFGLTVVPPALDVLGRRISSTRVREALTTGDIALATALLGRPWRVEGVVIHGEARGRTIGFPTANFQLQGQLAPRFGVYAVRVRTGDGPWRSGVANFGRTPTTGLRAPLFEVHVFDIDEDLYGQRIEVGLQGFIRPEATFDGLPALIARIGEDARVAREMLAHHR